MVVHQGWKVRSRTGLAAVGRPSPPRSSVVWRGSGRRGGSVRGRALVWVLTLVVAGAASLSAAPLGGGVRVGPKRPTCEEVIRLEAPLFVAVAPAGEEPAPESAWRYFRMRGGRTTDVVLKRGQTYALSIRMGEGPEAPLVPAFYRLEEGSLFTARVYWEDKAGEGETPRVELATDELSAVALETVLIEARSAGLRELRFQISPCYTGGARLARSPLEARVPLAVR